MKRIIIGLLAAMPLFSTGQNTAHLKQLKPDTEFENIHVRRIAGDSLSSQFVIWIKEQVPAHYHATHSETVVILKGKGQMKLGDQSFEVRKGDCIFIPQGTRHAVSVKKGVLQVLSIQSPMFDGTDRIPVD